MQTIQTLEDGAVFAGESTGMPKALLAFSGGLDTSACVLLLRDQGYQVVTATVDTGGFPPEESARIAARSRELGAIAHHHLDARADLYRDFASYVIKANYLRGGVYPACVGPERAVIAKKIAELAGVSGAAAVAHGSTGAGNDQIRFDLALRVLAPGLQVLAPIRSLGLAREQERDLLVGRGHAVSESAAAYSINVGLLGTTIGGRETLGTLGEPAEEAYTQTTPPHAAPDEAEDLVVEFEGGLPVGLWGERFDDGVALLHAAGTLAGRHGIGRGIHLGTTILGIKGRVAFEAPALITLIAAHQELEKAVLTSRQLFWKAQLGALYGDMLHEGLYFDPLMRDLEAFLDASARVVAGRVHLRLYKGHVAVVGCESTLSLLNPEVAVYGERNAYWDGRDAEGFGRIYGIEGVLAARARARAATAEKGGTHAFAHA